MGWKFDEEGVFRSEEEIRKRKTDYSVFKFQLVLMIVAIPIASVWFLLEKVGLIESNVFDDGPQISEVRKASNEKKIRDRDIGNQKDDGSKARASLLSPEAQSRADLFVPPKAGSEVVKVGASEREPSEPQREDASLKSEGQSFDAGSAVNLDVSTHDRVAVDQNSHTVKLAQFKGELAAVEAKIQHERDRWNDAVNVINKLTNFKRTPVREGSIQYQQCAAASLVIQEVEAGAPALKAEKARFEAMIQSLEGNLPDVR